MHNPVASQFTGSPLFGPFVIEDVKVWDMGFCHCSLKSLFLPFSFFKESFGCKKNTTKQYLH